MHGLYCTTIDVKRKIAYVEIAYWKKGEQFSPVESHLIKITENKIARHREREIDQTQEI